MNKTTDQMAGGFFARRPRTLKKASFLCRKLPTGVKRKGASNV